MNWNLKNNQGSKIEKIEEDIYLLKVDNVISNIYIAEKRKTMKNKEYFQSFTLFAIFCIVFLAIIHLGFYLYNRFYYNCAFAYYMQVTPIISVVFSFLITLNKFYGTKTEKMKVIGRFIGVSVLCWGILCAFGGIFVSAFHFKLWIPYYYMGFMIICLIWLLKWLKKMFHYRNYIKYNTSGEEKDIFKNETAIAKKEKSIKKLIKQEEENG